MNKSNSEVPVWAKKFGDNLTNIGSLIQEKKDREALDLQKHQDEISDAAAVERKNIIKSTMQDEAAKITGTNQEQDIK